MKNTKATRFCKITLFKIARKGKSADINAGLKKLVYSKTYVRCIKKNS